LVELLGLGEAVLPQMICRLGTHLCDKDIWLRNRIFLFLDCIERTAVTASVWGGGGEGRKGERKRKEIEKHPVMVSALPLQLSEGNFTCGFDVYSGREDQRWLSNTNKSRP